MKPPQTPATPPAKANKLMIRSEVVAVLQHLTTVQHLPKQERIKQLKRLKDLNQRDMVEEILVKELRRAQSMEMIRVITEFLMDIGSLDTLSDPLWSVIREVETTDEMKDAANLILRHLGDNTDPNLYLEYMHDPEALIERETERMLTISTENPEALIDFIDFILTLGTEDQKRIVATLQTEYTSDALVNLYIPLLESDPNPTLWELLIQILSETRSAEAAQLLARLNTWPADKLPVPKRLLEKALIQLKLSGAHQPETQTKTPSHPMILGTELGECYVTISDGIGNQGLIFSRKRPNGDVSMMCVAINDQHGVVDCFGFYDLIPADFHKICDKFHEGVTKIRVPASYCVYKLKAAEAINFANFTRIPYEFRCWLPLTDEVSPNPPADYQDLHAWANPTWTVETHNLFQHPDFNSWFWEQGDSPLVTDPLQQVEALTEKTLSASSKIDADAYQEALLSIAKAFTQALLASDWVAMMQPRLAEAAYLFHCQNTKTFCQLAATASLSLKNLDPEFHTQGGFVLTYAKKCIAEALLRYRIGHPQYEQLAPLVDSVLTAWGL